MDNKSNSKNLISDELNKESPDWRLIERLSRTVVDADPSSIRFNVDAGLIQRLGIELVSKQETALAELIKNAFDADASKVAVTFRNHDKIKGTLTIEDNGTGMSPEIVRNAWMCISTSNKAVHPVSARYKRIRAGRKGIGRFAVQRLGSSLILETEVQGVGFGTRVIFDWDLTFKAGSSLQDVFSEIEKYEKPIDKEGTKLVIQGLREIWSDAAIQRVWKAVLLLQPPFKVERDSVPEKELNVETPDPGFEVVINGHTSTYKKTELSIDSGFLDHAVAEIEGEIFPDGKAVVSVKSKKLEVDEKQEFDSGFLLTGPLKFSVKYFIYESELMSGISVSSALDLAKTYGGIRIYRNGFRVLPYGEPNDDWLRFAEDTARRHLIIPASNRNFFGYVRLTQEENILLEETSSREGLTENEAFEELRGFVRSGVEWAIKRVAAIRGRKQTAGQKDYVKEPPRKPTEILGELLNTVDASKNKEEKNVRPDDPGHSVELLEKAHAAISAAKAEAEAWERDVEQRQAASLEYEEMLRILAALGLSVSVFGHEVNGVRSSVALSIASLQKHLAAMSVEVGIALAPAIDDLKLSTSRMFDLGGYIAGLMSSTESRELKSLSAKGSVERFVRQFEHYMQRQKVQFEMPALPGHLRTVEMHASELDTVLLNFLTNSIKSMRRSKSDPRKIRISIEEEERHVLFCFEDNGSGIPDNIKEKVFDPFFTTTLGNEDDGVAGAGTGLGLKIVADIASSYGGSVMLGVPSNGYTCRFEFRVQKYGKE